MAEAPRYDNKQKQLVHQLMETVFSGAELDEFCAAHFASVCEQFTPDMGNAAKVQAFIEYASRHNRLGQLVARIQQAKPEAYQQFVERVRAPLQESPEPTESASPEPAAASLGQVGKGGLAARRPEGLVHQMLLGRYRIDDMLDKGGVGAVFKAYDTKLEIDVAIKIIDLDQVEQPALRERVLQEVRTTMKLDHPGIVQFYDFEQDNSLIYLLMEFISGYDLREAQQRFKALEKNTFLPPVTQLMQQICLTVDYMHQHGVLHPSLKPDNIMLKQGRTTEEPAWRPVLINLGLLRPQLEDLSEDEEVSTAQLTYSVSPELLLGHGTDIRSDVYALGIVLYELVVGQPPFKPKNLQEAIQLHVEQPPPRPRSIDPGLPESLEQITLKALAKDPADRYLSARGMAQALGRALAAPDVPVMAAEGDVTVAMEARPFVVAPGESLTTTLILRNEGTKEAHRQIRVQGVPPEWVSITPSLVTLQPGQEEAVEVSVQPPFSSLSRAGRHSVTVRVANQEDPQQVEEFKKALTVAPYVQFNSSLWPHELTAGQVTQVTVENLGNVSETFTIQARPEEDLVFKPDRKRLKLGAGESGVVDFEVAYRRRRWVGEPRLQTFSLLVGSPQTQTVIHSGEVSDRSPLRLRWVLAVVLLLMLFACAVIAFYPLVNPSSGAATATIIQANSQLATFEAATAQVLAAQTATVEAAATQTAQAVSGSEQAATATAVWLAGDEDRDGLSNGTELEVGTDPFVRDTDGDGLDDEAEVITFRTNPLNPDTDYDGILDGEEIRRNLDPRNRDTDGDSTPDSTDIDPGRVPTPTDTATPNPTATRTPSVRFNNSSYTVDEREGEVVVTVILDAPAGNQVTVDYATSGETASAGGDYRTTVGTLVFNPGATVERFTVPIVNDTTDESDETLNVFLSNPQGVNLGSPAQATLIILDDDEPISIRFSQGSRLLGLFETERLPIYQVEENQGQAIIDVVLSAPASEPVRVDFTTNDGTALAGQDYIPTGGTLLFDPGQNRQVFVVRINNDDISEVNENLILTLSNAIGARIDTPRAELIIDDDD